MVEIGSQNRFDVFGDPEGYYVNPQQRQELPYIDSNWFLRCGRCKLCGCGLTWLACAGKGARRTLKNQSTRIQGKDEAVAPCWNPEDNCLFNSTMKHTLHVMRVNITGSSI